MSDQNEYGFGSGHSASVSFGGNGSASGEASGPVKDISTEEFMTEVVEASMQMPVLVDFWAEWCGPCKQLAPVLESAVAATRGKVKLVKMDIEKYPEIANQMRIQSIPAVVAFANGRPANAFTGAKPEGEIREFIAAVAGPSDEEVAVDALLEQAQALVEQDQNAQASQIYGQILSVQPHNLQVIGALGQIYVKDDNLAAAKGLMEHLDKEQLKDADIVSLQSAIELAEQAESLGSYGELESLVASEPDNHQARMDLAVALNANGKREDAADHLLEIIRKAPQWNEEAARKQLLQFFEAWGMTDETTLSARRRLSSLLFS